MGITASELIARVSVVGVDQATAQLGRMGGATDAAGAKFGKLAALGAGVLAVGLAAVAAKAVSMAGNFEQATNTLITSAGLSKNSIDAVRTGILKMSVDTATGTDQLVKGMFNVQSALHLGAGGLQVLKAAAEGAKAENSDLAATTDVLTTAMVNYHLGAAMAVPVMNSLIVTIAAGKMHMNDLTGALRNVLPFAAAFHIHLSDVEGALATMANAGDRGTLAGTHLAMMFKMLEKPVGSAKKEMAAMGIDSLKLAQTMQTSLPQALKMIQDAVTKHFKPGTAEYNRAILDILGGSKSGAAGLEIFNQGLKALGKNTADAGAAMHKGGKDVENWSTIQSSFNFKLDAAKNTVGALFIQLGTKLLPVLGQMAGAFSNVVSYIGDFSKHSDVLVPVLAGIGAVLLAVVVPAVWSLAAGILAATWPALAIGVAVAALVAVFKHFYDTNAGFKKFIDNLVAGFKVFASVVGTVVSSITNDEEKLRIAHEQKMVAMRIATDTNTAKGAQQAISNLEKQRAGILLKLKQTHDPAQKMELEHQLKMNTLQIQHQKQRLDAAEKDKQAQIKKQKELHDQMLEAQKWFGQRFLDMVGQWLGHVFSAIGTWARNSLTAIKNFFGDTFSNLGSFIRNFLDSIGRWKDSVIAKVAQLATDFVADIKAIPGKLAGLANDLISAGAQIVKNIASGIVGAIGQFIGGAMSAVGSFISSHLPHSPAKVGPLKDLQLQGSLIPQQIAQGILAGQHHLNGVLKPMALSMSLSATGGLSPSVAGGLSPSVARSVATSGGGQPVIVINVNPELKMDGVRLSQTLLPHLANRMRYNI